MRICAGIAKSMVHLEGVLRLRCASPGLAPRECGLENRRGLNSSILSVGPYEGYSLNQLKICLLLDVYPQSVVSLEMRRSMSWSTFL